MSLLNVTNLRETDEGNGQVSMYRFHVPHQPFGIAPVEQRLPHR